jgi:hypothetical protein
MQKVLGNKNLSSVSENAKDGIESKGKTKRKSKIDYEISLDKFEDEETKGN